MKLQIPSIPCHNGSVYTDVSKTRDCVNVGAGVQCELFSFYSLLYLLLMVKSQLSVQLFRSSRTVQTHFQEWWSSRIREQLLRLQTLHVTLVLKVLMIVLTFWDGCRIVRKQLSFSGSRSIAVLKVIRPLTSQRRRGFHSTAQQSGFNLQFHQDDSQIEYQGLLCSGCCSQKRSQDLVHPYLRQS